MMHFIEEIPIINPNEKKPLFINYSEISSDSGKRLRFLRALIKIVNLNQTISHYENLGLRSEDIDDFKQFLTDTYPEFCRVHKKTVNMDDFDGKVICNIDKLIDDIFSILSQTEIESRSIEITNGDINGSSSKIENTVIQSEKNNFVLIDPLVITNKFLIEIFDEGIAPAEVQLFVTRVIKETKPEDIEMIFASSSLRQKIGKIPLKIKNHETHFEDVVSKKDLILSILRKFSLQLPNKKYWETLSKDIESYFMEIIDKCDQEKIEIITEKQIHKNVTINEILLDNEIIIFYAEAGDPTINDRNPVISHYNNKIALFNSRFELSKKIQLGDCVLAYFEEQPTFVRINPIAILHRNVTMKLIKNGIELSPPLNEILEKLNTNPSV
jgi:hypothetical protein